MIILEQCRIDHDRGQLVIDAVVENLEYYKDVYIASVVIDTDKSYSPNGPSSNPAYLMNFEEESLRVVTDSPCTNVSVDEDCKCGDVYTKRGRKRVSLRLDAEDLGVSLNERIFFVYVIATGIPSPHTPCGMDNSYVMGVTVNMRPIYNMSMKYIKELDSTCSIPRGFIDSILRLKAFDLSMKTGNYPIAFKQWDKLLRNKSSVVPKKGCGCNGIN